MHRHAEPFHHPAVFYRDPDEYLASLVPFITDGLDAGEPIAVAVPGENLAALRDAVGDRSDQVHWVTMTVAGRNPGWIIPGVLRAFADQHERRHVRVIGEPIWPGRSAEEYPACVQHEALINHAFQGRNVSIACPYDVRNLPADVLADAEATHPVLQDGASPERPSPRYAPDDVIGRYNQLSPPPPEASTSEVEARDLSSVRRSLAGMANEVGFPESRIEDLVLAATELLTNSIEYGDGYAILRTWWTGSELVCEVSGPARLTDPLAGRRPAKRGQSRGRGLLLVNGVADLVRTHTGDNGTTIRAYFAPAHATEPQAMAD